MNGVRIISEGKGSRKDFHFYFKGKWSRAALDSDRMAAVSGEAWISGRLLRGEEFARSLLSSEYFKTPQGHRNSQQIPIPENGFFAFVLICGDYLFAAVDRIRSRPLFYGHAEGGFYISDDARWLRKSLGKSALDCLAEEEFHYAGFVTGRDTLFSDIKQLQAGECLLVKKGVCGPELVRSRYYSYLGGDFFEDPASDLIILLNRVFTRAFKRLIKSVGERTILVPLSGGLDSRLIIAMLKRLGHKKVIAFSYGKKGNKESAKSRSMAEKVGYPWIFIDYTGRMWRECYNGREFDEYLKYADGLSSLPHIDDWPAVRELKKRRMIPDDTVFVPGHTGDFISGGHIPPSYLDYIHMDKNRLIESITKKHYRINDLKKAPENLRRRIRRRIENHLPKLPVDDIEKAGYLFEFFDWQERQAKYIVNSLRVYEFWGYEWQIPLWDAEIMDFWRRTRFKHKISKTLYKKYLRKTNFAGAFGDVDATQRRYPRPLRGLFRILSRPYHASADYLGQYAKRYMDYFLHKYQYFSIFPYFEVAFKKGQFQNINTFLVREHIKRVKKRMAEE